MSSDMAGNIKARKKLDKALETMAKLDPSGEAIAAAANKIIRRLAREQEEVSHPTTSDESQEDLDDVDGDNEDDVPGSISRHEDAIEEDATEEEAETGVKSTPNPSKDRGIAKATESKADKVEVKPASQISGEVKKARDLKAMMHQRASTVTSPEQMQLAYSASSPMSVGKGQAAIPNPLSDSSDDVEIQPSPSKKRKVQATSVKKMKKNVSSPQSSPQISPQISPPASPQTKPKGTTTRSKTNVTPQVDKMQLKTAPPSASKASPNFGSRRKATRSGKK